MTYVDPSVLNPCQLKSADREPGLSRSNLTPLQLQALRDKSSRLYSESGRLIASQRKTLRDLPEFGSRGVAKATKYTRNESWIIALEVWCNDRATREPE